MHKTIGWDIGGAHLKAVLLDCQGHVIHVQQVSCPLWLGLDQLETAISNVLEDFELKSNEAFHAITMTGELVDLFANRHDGVVQIVQLTASLLGVDIWFYYMDKLNQHCFLHRNDALENTNMIASANWHASARLLSKEMPNALLVDIGSTTTDIIAVEGGIVANTGYTDAERMQLDTLVYTGVVRTPVMAVTQKLAVEGTETNVAAEYFATMADVYRLTGELPEVFDLTDTADGEAKTLIASAARLARMVGHDGEDKPIDVWQQLARDCRAKQLQQIKWAVLKHIKDGMTIVGAGVGRFLVQSLADELPYPYADFASQLKGDDKHVAACLPAYAVAQLAFLKRSA
ncbi:MAG: hydantoinase/oxoprolinase family protein [Methylophilaceae bacterium]